MRLRARAAKRARIRERASRVLQDTIAPDRPRASRDRETGTCSRLNERSAPMNFTQSLDIPLAASPPSTRKSPGKRETSGLCRERAAADLLASAAMINANQRLRLETSAESWTLRADMLERVEESFARRTAEVAARAIARNEAATQPMKL